MANPISIDTAREARAVAEIRELLALEESAPQRAARLGELFTECKEAVGHGNWLPWLRAHGFDSQTASIYMRAYRATKTPHEAEFGNSSVREIAAQAPSQRKKKSWGWISALQNFGGVSMQFGGSQARKLSEARGEDVTEFEFTNKKEAQAFALWGAAVLRPDATIRDEVPESMKAKFDRLLKKAEAQLEATFWDKVITEVNRRMPEEKAEALETIRDYNTRMKGIAPHLSEENYKFLLGILHPDREPTKEQREKGFTIVRSLDVYMNAFRKHRT